MYKSNSNVKCPHYDIEYMVNQALNLCLSSSFIRNNELYSKKVDSIQYVYTDSAVLNSYASICIDAEEGSKDDECLVPMVTTFAGLSMFMSLFAAIFTEYLKDRNVRYARKAGLWIVDNLQKDCEYEGYILNGLDMEKVPEFYKMFSKYSNEDNFASYKELTVKMIMGVLGHETGHHCLGHLFGDRRDNTITRNQEREADLFSCSVCQGTGLGSNFVLGEILCELGFYYLSKGKIKKDATHPDSAERIMNMYNSFKKEIEYTGFSFNDIKKLMEL